ncbi:MAG TPA: hypothetical protein VJV23_06940, partial [Candidatus Polarisedimenticolia bacterium]|nr:hypothetical protein [Candidatus Polarisedimenticolia bacterium]
MTNRRRQGLAARIREWLSERGAPASSALLVERFLRTAAPDEATATRLLAPALAAQGLRYAEGSGWEADAAPGELRRAAGGPMRLVAAGRDASGRDFVLEEVEQERRGGPALSSSPCLEDAALVVADRRRDGEALAAWLRLSGIGSPARIVSLRA